MTVRGADDRSDQREHERHDSEADDRLNRPQHSRELAIEWADPWKHEEEVRDEDPSHDSCPDEDSPPCNIPLHPDISDREQRPRDDYDEVTYKCRLRLG